LHFVWHSEPGAGPQQSKLLSKVHEHPLTFAFPSSQRNLPARGFRPGALLAIGGVVMAYGWWRLTQGIREQKYVPFPPQTSPLSLHACFPLDTRKSNERKRLTRAQRV
jgi:hypothetical protein